MRLHSSGCLRWSYLPQEVRRNILNTIVDQRNPRWSALASVSKEWQSVIGTRNMAKLNLRPSCLEDFEQAVVRQRDLVRHIYFNVELVEYKCSHCTNVFASAICYKNDRLMGEAVNKLLIILSTWNTTTPLTLELNASSASDSKHFFKNFRFNDEHDAHYVETQSSPRKQRIATGTTPSTVGKMVSRRNLHPPSYMVSCSGVSTLITMFATNIFPRSTQLPVS